MNIMRQTITLTSHEHYGRRLPPDALARALIHIPAIVRGAVSMAFRGRSSLPESRPGWLATASDVRFVGHEGADASVLYFELPCLGDAAPELYQPGEPGPTRPDSRDTAFDLWCDILADVDAGNQDSDRFDPTLLRRLVHFSGAFAGTFREMLISGRRYAPPQPGRMTSSTLNAARNLYSSTPAPQRIRLAGLLHSARATTQTIGLRLDDGHDVRGTLPASRFVDLAPLLNQRVLVLGRAIYRASGRLLRVDVNEILPSAGGDHFFSTVPAPRRATLNLPDEFRAQQAKGGLPAIIGQWPGDETDEEIEQALRELS